MPILEGPSDQSKMIAKENETTKANVQDWEREIHGLDESSDSNDETVKKKPKVKKNPNPLSCRKKQEKESKMNVSEGSSDKKRTTRRKKRSKARQATSLDV